MSSIVGLRIAGVNSPMSGNARRRNLAETAGGNCGGNGGNGLINLRWLILFRWFV